MPIFPENLTISGKRVVIDKSRVLLSFKNSLPLEKVEELLKTTNFELENNYQRNLKSNQRLTKPETINDTDKRFWIHALTDPAVGEERLDALRHLFRDELDWVGPVYNSSEESNLRDLFSPLPNVLLIKFISTMDEQNHQFLQILKNYNLHEVPEKSKYLNGYRYFNIINPESKNAYQLRMN
jgi:hypothetical protein